MNYVHSTSTRLFVVAAPQEIEEGIWIKNRRSLAYGTIEGSSELRSYAVRWRVAGLALSLEVGEDISRPASGWGGGKSNQSCGLYSLGYLFPSQHGAFDHYQVEWRQQAVELVLTG